MKALVQTKVGSPDVLQVQEWPKPTAGPGQIRVKVHACGLNYAEVQARIGFYPDAPKPPSVLGYEVAGEVESIGDGVTGYEVGERVIAGSRFSGFAELVVSNVDDVVALPDSYSYEEGAAIPVAYSTAYACLVMAGNVQPGEHVLIHGAAGGVGIAATQIAKHLGAVVYGTSSASKHDAIRSNGVDYPIDYRSQDVSEAVRNIIGKERGLDLILDPRGGKAFKESYDLLWAGGRLVPFGVRSVLTGDKRNLVNAAKTMAQMPRFNAIKLMTESRSVLGINMLRYWDDHGSLKNLIGPVQQLMKEGVVKPIVAKTFPLEQAADAHRFIQNRKNIGKVILTVI